MSNTPKSRAAAKAALDAYRELPGFTTLSTGEALHDLIVDLLHWADANIDEMDDQSGEEVVDKATDNYYEEVETDDDDQGELTAETLYDDDLERSEDDDGERYEDQCDAPDPTQCDGTCRNGPTVFDIDPGTSATRLDSDPGDDGSFQGEPRGDGQLG